MKKLEAFHSLHPGLHRGKEIEIRKLVSVNAVSASERGPAGIIRVVARAHIKNSGVPGFR
jgi:hypothetical protein